MRGKKPEQPSMLALVSIESMLPEKHPIRAIKPVVDGVRRELSPRLDGLYASTGRPSVPPERLLKAMVLMALFSVRSERMFCERLGYDMLFRWFLDMEIVDVPFDPTTFTQNRDRLLNTVVARLFFEHVREYAERQNLMSNEHFSVDGTLIQAWASMKSFRPKDDDSGDNNGFGDFKGTKRSNDTHESKTDPDAKLFRKGRGQEAKLFHGPRPHGEPPRHDRRLRGHRRDRHRRTRRWRRHAEADARPKERGEAQACDGRRRQGVRHEGLRREVPGAARHAPRRPEHQRAPRLRDRRSRHREARLRDEPAR